MSSYTIEDLKTMQNWPLERKIKVTQTRIIEWYIRWNGQVYVSFSGGKDSTVLLDLARRIYPDIEAVFVDTGLEYPEIKEFVKTFDNLTILRPEMSFNQVVEKYGYPIISKEQAGWIKDYQRGSTEKMRSRINKVSKKWRYLGDAPFRISDECCNVLKKKPIKIYEKISGKHPIVGTLATESRKRIQDYLKTGCNAFYAKRPISKPLSFWTEQDILTYLRRFDIPYCSIYGDIVDTGGQLVTTGVERTGCMFCMFGVHLDKEPNRFQKMATTHPKLYDYCINKLGCGKVLDYIGVNYKPTNESFDKRMIL